MITKQMNRSQIREYLENHDDAQFITTEACHYIGRSDDYYTYQLKLYRKHGQRASDTKIPIDHDTCHYLKHALATLNQYTENGLIHESPMGFSTYWTPKEIFLQIIQTLQERRIDTIDNIFRDMRVDKIENILK